MSISVVSDNGEAVVTVVTNNDSRVPRLCSVNKAVIQTSVVAALGIVQIMVGFFNIGLGPERIEAYPYWLGILFITAGIVSLLVAMRPSSLSVVFAAFVNIVGSVFAIVGIVLYALHLAKFSVIQMCSSAYARDSDANCRYVAYLAQRLLRGVDITLIVLAVLQLCVCISLAVLGYKAVCYRGKEHDVSDVEVYQPLLEENFTTSPGTMSPSAYNSQNPTLPLSV